MEELEAYGMPYPKIDERFRRLEETVKLLKYLFHRRRGSFDGEFYRLPGKDLRSGEFKDWRSPIIVGGGGHRNISIAALLGDGWNIFNPSIESFLEQYKKFRAYCASYNRNRPAKCVSVAVTCIVESESRKAKRKFQLMYPRTNSYESYQLPRYVGSIRHLANFLSHYVTVGANELIINLPDTARLDLIEALGERVLPSIR